MVNMGDVRFIAYINETNYGCDYTIACGKAVMELKAEIRDEAIKELKDRVIGVRDGRGYNTEDCFSGEPRIVSATLYEVASTYHVPLDDWYAERDRVESEGLRAREEKERRNQYETLKAEFE